MVAMEEMSEEYKQFKKQIRGTRKGAKNKVNNTFGAYDCYKLMRKNGWYNIGRPLKEKEYYHIIRSINDLIAEELSKGQTFIMPLRMGKLELRKYQCGAYMKDGKLKVTYPVNWEKTCQLWFNDPEAHRQKTLLRDENPFIYHIRYCTEGSVANYQNKYFYQFAPNTFIKKALSKNIKQGKIDTLW